MGITSKSRPRHRGESTSLPSKTVSSVWTTSGQQYICLAEPPPTQAYTFYILTQPYPPPTLCLCSELEWLVFHFGLLYSLAWPVYHYWSLSLTWTNRGLFSKVVSQVAVTDMSGTTGLRSWLKHTVSHAKNLPGHKPDSIIHGTQTFW